jgi:hypothetical protein
MNDSPQGHVDGSSEEGWRDQEQKRLYDIGTKCPNVLRRDCTPDISDDLDYDVYVS